MSALRPLRAALTLSLLPLAVGCATARMELPDALAAAPEHPVDGRQGLRIRERLTFGPWHTTAVQRSWTSSPSYRIDRLEWARSRQRYSFTLAHDEEGAWRGECEAGARALGVHVAGGVVGPEDEAGLRCTLTPVEGSSEPWTLTLAARGDAAPEGRLTRAGERLTVRGTRRMQGGRLPAEGTTGYTFSDDAGTPLAAVEVINRGAVRIPAELAPARRGALSAAATALLLLEDLRAHVDLAER